MPDHLPELDRLVAQEYGPAFALRGALLVHRDGSQSRDPMSVRLAAGYWLTGAADHEDGASAVLYDEFELDRMDKLDGFDLEFVVAMFLRSETSARKVDPDARRFMIGVAEWLDHTDYARELSRRP